MCKAVLLGTAITTLSWMLPLPGADLQDPCQATPNSDDVQLTLSLDHHEPVFHPGEVIPLVLSFHSTRANDYQVRIQNSDRSGRLAVDTYCLDGAWSDPLHRYFGSWSGGMMGGLSFLQTPPASVQTQLNEWKTPGPGHHRLFVVSLRVEPRDRRAPSREGEAPSQVVVRSNAIEFEVGPPDPEWALQELRAAREALRAARPASADRIAAVRRVRFLQSEEAARELPRLWALYPDQELSSNFLFGAWSSPFPEIVVQSMKAALAMPDGTVTSAFLHTLAKIDSLLADRHGDGDGFRLSLHAAFQTTMEALARKTSHARALTVGEIFWMPPAGDPEWDGQEEFWLMTAIATGTHWTAGPTAFARLEPLLASSSNRDQLASWRNAWRQPAAVIEPQWIDGACEQFQVLQYGPLDAEGLSERIRRLPREMKVQWKVDSVERMVPEVTVADQEACYARFAALGVERGPARVER